jgi:hypothetical protein
MTVPRRTRMAAAAAAISAALVLGMTGTAIALEDLDCSDFTYQEDAQAVLDADPSDPHRLDGGADGAADGVACESLPHRPAGEQPPVTPTDDPEPSEEPEAPPAPESTPETTPPAVPAVAADRDCRDFPNQAAAQAALESRPDDPEWLDADSDGIACEQHFGTEGRQVAVIPVGGVATGGFPSA